jgi:hypothetical protein
MGTGIKKNIYNLQISSFMYFINQTVWSNIREKNIVYSIGMIDIVHMSTNIGKCAQYILSQFITQNSKYISQVFVTMFSIFNMTKNILKSLQKAI